MCVSPNKRNKQVVCAASSTLLDACTASWQLSANCLTRTLCWVRPELSESSETALAEPFFVISVPVHSRFIFLTALGEE